MVKVGINGFGRIGKLAFQLLSFYGDIGLQQQL